MTQIFYHKFSTPFPIKKWGFYFQQLPEDIQERIRRYRKEENKYQLMIGRLLLKDGMLQLGYRDFRLTDLYYNEYNCPLWSNDILFNIAHSGNVVACAFSDELKIGLDIEKIRELNLNNFDYILNELDHQNIEKAINRYEAFFKIWTIKEAVTKALGKGLSIDVQQIYIYAEYAVLEETKWYYQSFSFEEGYAAHLVMDENKLATIKLEVMSF